MEPGKYYLFIQPFFMTYVAKYVRHINFQEIEVDHAIYFTRTGATFDLLMFNGLTSETQSHPCGNGILLSSQGPKHPWHAATDWPNPSEEAPAKKGRK